MAFSEEVIQEAWQRSGGVCECKRYEHNHANYRCSNNITFAHRGTESQGAWETHYIEKGARKLRTPVLVLSQALAGKIINIS
jgi:hypothetical protein